ncbi:hypothetical protein HN011_000529 [Eciton burchellii]|nr:hypothetical protein HN011_000529 [Eciton burchellii]
MPTDAAIVAVAIVAVISHDDVDDRHRAPLYTDPKTLVDESRRFNSPDGNHRKCPTSRLRHWCTPLPSPPPPPPLSPPPSSPVATNTSTPSVAEKEGTNGSPVAR